MVWSNSTGSENLNECRKARTKTFLSPCLDLDVTYWLPDNPSENDGFLSVVATSEGGKLILANKNLILDENLIIWKAHFAITDRFDSILWKITPIGQKW